MKTTLNLPDALYEQVRQTARDEGRTVTSFVEDALRAALAADAPGAAAPDLPLWHSGGTLVDLDDRDALWDALDSRA